MPPTPVRTYVAVVEVAVGTDGTVIYRLRWGAAKPEDGSAIAEGKDLKTVIENMIEALKVMG